MPYINNVSYEEPDLIFFSRNINVRRKGFETHIFRNYQLPHIDYEGNRITYQIESITDRNSGFDRNYVLSISFSEARIDPTSPTYRIDIGLSDEFLTSNEHQYYIPEDILPIHKIGSNRSNQKEEIHINSFVEIYDPNDRHFKDVGHVVGISNGIPTIYFVKFSNESISIPYIANQLNKVLPKTVMTSDDLEELPDDPTDQEIRFKKLDLDEILLESRTKIPRFYGESESSDKEFVSFLYYLTKITKTEGKSSYILDIDDTNPFVKLIEKVDSLFCQFGLDQSRNFFMESSNSGQVTAKDAQERFGFSEDLLKSFNYLAGNKEFQSTLRRIFNKVGAFRYSAELFPVLTHQVSGNNEISFSATTYNASKFGENGAFVVFECEIYDNKSNDWIKMPVKDSDQYVSLLQKSFSDQNQWKIYTNNENMRFSASINVKIDQNLATYLISDKKFSELLSKINENDVKQAINSTKQAFQTEFEQIADKTSSALGKGPLEGVILQVSSDKSNKTFKFKATSSNFKQNKAKNWNTRSKAEDIYNKFFKSAMNLLKIRKSDDKSLNKIIKASIPEFMNDVEHEYKVRNLYLDFLIPKLIDEEVDFDQIGSVFAQLIEQTEKQISQIYNRDSSNDFNIRRKEEESKKNVLNRLNKLKKCCSNSKLPIPCIIDILIGYKIDKHVTFDINSDYDPNRKDNVIIWTGRAQPWHIGHYRMVEEGKNLLSDFKASQVVIVLVEGDGTEESPLSGNEQLKLVQSIYAKDRKVKVLRTLAKDSYITSIAPLLKKYNVVGWLAGDDRLDEYKNSLYSFNSEQFKSEYGFSPFNRDGKGKPQTIMLRCKKVFSGSRARSLSKETSFPQWINYIMPGVKLDDDTNYIYYYIWGRLRNK